MCDDDRLADYRDKRDSSVTPEPDGGSSGSSDGPIFVIQKHDASTHHFDLRIEIDGVLKSWSVPKGPSTDPSDTRMAIPTEDHPVDYADFEGVIPEDEYGGGTVLVWDRGPYRNLRRDKEDDGASMTESYDDGKVEVRLDGDKIRGGYALIRTGSKDDDGARWLLVKMDDDESDARRNPTSTEPESVVSGRTLDEIAEDVVREEGG
jgi:DNA ligase D-like protein (predicted 3'-phosphoesterase)